MQLLIDNLDGFGLRDYTTAVDGSRLPQIIRKLNLPCEFKVSLIADASDFLVPALGARVVLRISNGQILFTGYLMQSPAFEYLGWGEAGPAYRYDLVVISDEALLDEKRLPDRCPFVERSAGSALQLLTEDAIAGGFDTSGIQGLDPLAGYAPDPQKSWSQQAAEVAILARASYRTLNGAIMLTPVGAAAHELNETDSNFSAQGLRLQSVNALMNDVTIVGEVEPQPYVTDYFVGNGLTLKYYLSQAPFTKTSTTLFDEEYTTWPLEPTLWAMADPAGAISVNGGKLQIAGGTGVDGATTVQFVEKIELGGALVMQHGDAMFNAASNGVLGGLYPGAISLAGCLAGFGITPNGGQSNIQAVVSGVGVGSLMGTTSGHHYVLTTRVYAQEIYRRQQIFHSSAHPAGSGVGGAEVSADVRIILEVQDIDPDNPASEVAPATVLYDGVISGAPDFCTYATVNAVNLQCAIAFTRLVQAVDAEVRSAPPGQSYRTRLVGSLKEGAECSVTSSALEFYSQYVPAANELIEVHYRGRGQALARITNPASIAAQQRGIDDGLHGAVRRVKEPLPRTATDCENAALALLDDSTGAAWTGEYDTWSDFLPGRANDIFPGDALNVNVPSRGAMFVAAVHEVEIMVKDLNGENSFYRIKFANDAAMPLGFGFEAASLVSLPLVTELANTQVGQFYLPELTAAAITNVTSTTVSVDAGAPPPSGGGIEVRWSDAGWGPGNDRNLIGRFTTQTFTIPRLSAVQNCYLQQYDASVPPKYSRYTTALHVDYPL